MITWLHFNKIKDFFTLIITKLALYNKFKDKHLLMTIYIVRNVRFLIDFDCFEGASTNICLQQCA